MFIGRRHELKQLRSLLKKNTASLVTIMGRRRIGKSSLIEEFGKDFKEFIIIQGLGPEVNAGRKEQLDHFDTSLSLHFNKRKQRFEDWTEAFYYLAEQTQKKRCLILLDEISWMSKGDPLFAAKLKDVWDLKFKKNNQLIMALCGSVSAWIEKNILNNSNFVGRISLQLHLKELSLPEINQFWKRKKYSAGSMEKMLILSVVGGVPKYLEEVLLSETSDNNLIRMCFTPSGILYNEYDKIFKDIFERKTGTFEKIINACLTTKLNPLELSKVLKKSYDGEFSEHLHNLELSGFLSRDFYYKFDGKQGKFSQLRVQDNYTRFYLKFIQPIKNKISTQSKQMKSLTEIKNIDSILGLQFENLILSNRRLLYPLLDLQESNIISAAPYQQRKTIHTKGACQIDILIHAEIDMFYVCEIKCKKIIDKSIINEVNQKIKVLSLPKRSSLRKVLIYEGELYPPHQEELNSFFYRIIHFDDLLNSPESFYE